MIDNGTGCFLQIEEDCTQQILYPATVIGQFDETYIVEPDQGGIELEPETDVVICFEKEGRFLQLSGRVQTNDSIELDGCESENDPEQLFLTIKTTGRPVSAESRQHCRVSTANSGFQAVLNDEEACRVLDVSPTGLSVISKERYRIGDMLDVSIVEGAQSFAGIAKVHSVRDTGLGWTRYGLCCVSDRNSKKSLGDGLRQISMRLQREQLSRAAGST